MNGNAEAAGSMCSVNDEFADMNGANTVGY